MGAVRKRFVCKAVPGEGWRIWSRTSQRWWGNYFVEFPSALLAELNGDKRPDRINALSKAAKKPTKKK